MAEALDIEDESFGGEIEGGMQPLSGKKKIIAERVDSANSAIEKEADKIPKSGENTQSYSQKELNEEFQREYARAVEPEPVSKDNEPKIEEIRMSEGEKLILERVDHLVKEIHITKGLLYGIEEKLTVIEHNQIQKRKVRSSTKQKRSKP